MDFEREDRLLMRGKLYMYTSMLESSGKRLDDVVMRCLVEVTLEVYVETCGLECIGEMLLIQLRSLLLGEGGDLSDVHVELAGRIMDETKLEIGYPVCDDMILRSLVVDDLRLFRFVVKYVDRILPCSVASGNLHGVVWSYEKTKGVFDEMMDLDVKVVGSNARRLMRLCVEYSLMYSVANHPAHDCDDACKVVRMVSGYVKVHTFEKLNSGVICPMALRELLMLEKVDNENFVEYILGERKKRESVECEPVVKVFCDYMEHQNNKRVKV